MNTGPWTILVVQPDPLHPIDLFGLWLTGGMVRLRTVRLFEGDRVPAELTDRGLIVLGGRMSAGDDAEFGWLQDVRDLLVDAHRRRRPVLGIGLGGQLLAQAFGGRVGPGAAGVEAGLVRVRIGDGADVDPLFDFSAGVTLPSVTLHRDTVTDLPPDAHRLGGTDAYPNQVFSVDGRSWGVQFHPEASPATFARWAAELDEPDPAGADGRRRRAFQQYEVPVLVASRKVAQRFCDLTGRSWLERVTGPPRLLDPPREPVPALTPPVTGPPPPVPGWYREEAEGRPMVVVVQPDPLYPIDLFGYWLRSEGIGLRTVRPFAGDPVPATVEDLGLIVLGGRMSAADDAGFPWLQQIRDLLLDAHRKRCPVLGIGLGAQLVAQAHGGTVARGAAGLEAGLVDVRMVDAGYDDLLATSCAGRHYSTALHRDAITELPPGARRRGGTESYPNQAFVVGDFTWGLQFHPEASPATFARWVDEVADPEPGLASGLRHRALLANAEELRSNSRAIAGSFASLVRPRTWWQRWREPARWG